MCSPALGPAVLCFGNDVAFATSRFAKVWLSSLAFDTRLASGLMPGAPKVCISTVQRFGLCHRKVTHLKWYSKLFSETFGFAFSWYFSQICICVLLYCDTPYPLGTKLDMPIHIYSYSPFQLFYSGWSMSALFKTPLPPRFEAHNSVRLIVWSQVLW